MEKRIAYYRLDNSEASWLTLVKSFKKNLSKNGVPYFTGRQATAESEFTQFCSDNEIKMTRKVLTASSGTLPLKRSHYYFSVRDTQEFCQDFMSLDCAGGGKATCWTGAKQEQKMVVTADTVAATKQKDILLKALPVSPPIYLVSNFLKEQMEQAAFSGVVFTPCLDARLNYTPEEAIFGSQSSRIEQRAPCFQMTVTEPAIGKPKIGKLMTVKRCPRCQAASIIEGSQEWVFQATDLASSDFQFVTEVTSTDEGDLIIAGSVAIVSAKALSFLIKLQVKGLRPYSVDPPAKFVAVEISE